MVFSKYSIRTSICWNNENRAVNKIIKVGVSASWMEEKVGRWTLTLNIFCICSCALSLVFFNLLKWKDINLLLCSLNVTSQPKTYENDICQRKVIIKNFLILFMNVSYLHSHKYNQHVGNQIYTFIVNRVKIK